MNKPFGIGGREAAILKPASIRSRGSFGQVCGYGCPADVCVVCFTGITQCKSRSSRHTLLHRVAPDYSFARRYDGGVWDGGAKVSTVECPNRR